MSSKTDEKEPAAVEAELSPARLLFGAVIGIIVPLTVLYPALATMDGTTAHDVYANQKTLLMAVGGFILHAAYMAGFRSVKNAYTLASNYMITALVVITMGTAAYVFGVEGGRIPEWLYWVLMIGSVSATMIPIAIHDRLQFKKDKTGSERSAGE